MLLHKESLNLSVIQAANFHLATQSLIVRYSSLDLHPLYLTLTYKHDRGACFGMGLIDFFFQQRPTTGNVRDVRIIVKQTTSTPTIEDAPPSMAH